MLVGLTGLGVLPGQLRRRAQRDEDYAALTGRPGWKVSEGAFSQFAREGPSFKAQLGLYVPGRQA